MPFPRFPLSSYQRQFCFLGVPQEARGRLSYFEISLIFMEEEKEKGDVRHHVNYAPRPFSFLHCYYGGSSCSSFSPPRSESLRYSAIHSSMQHPLPIFFHVPRHHRHRPPVRPYMLCPELLQMSRKHERKISLGINSTVHVIRINEFRGGCLSNNEKTPPIKTGLASRRSSVVAFTLAARMAKLELPLLSWCQ